MDSNAVTGLLDRIRGQSLERRKAAAETLRTILLRPRGPEADDEERITEAVATLGLETDELPSLLDLVEKRDRYARLLADSDDRQQALYDAKAAMLEIDRWHAQRLKELDAERDARRKEAAPLLSRATVQCSELADARRWRDTVEAKWVALVEGITEEEARAGLYRRAAEE